MRAQQAQSEKDLDRWVNAMPTALRAIWSNALGEFGKVHLEPLRTELESRTADRGERILALLEWYGSGAGPWSGFPSYEGAAEGLLFDYRTTEIIAAAQSKTLTPAQTEGLGRLFAGWEFGKQRAEDLRQIPENLKQNLWHHIQNTHDKDKYSRGKSIFSK